MFWIWYCIVRTGHIGKHDISIKQYILIEWSLIAQVQQTNISYISMTRKNLTIYKYYSEIREEWDRWVTNFWLTLENMESLVCTRKLLATMCIYSFPKSTKVVFKMQGAWHSPNMLPRYGFTVRLSISWTDSLTSPHQEGIPYDQIPVNTLGSSVGGAMGTVTNIYIYIYIYILGVKNNKREGCKLL